MPEKEKANIILFSGDLDKALAAFIIATTAASMGMEVNMFFTFWGLNVIKKNEGRLKSKGFRLWMLNLLNRGGTKRLALSKLHMFGMGTSMMKALLKENKFPSIEELIALAKKLGVKMTACTTTCGVMGLDESGFRPEVDTLAGAATFLGDARKAKINLFI